MKRAQIYIAGIVQGVGFRPFVYREAVARGILGWVLNAGDGVHVEACAPDETALREFFVALQNEAPAAARIDCAELTLLDDVSDENSGDAAGFRIIASDGSGELTTLVSPDIATCPDCLRELFDPADRRYHYPFINCTNCGPRYTIIRALPYDRGQTSMHAFPMCPDCAAEYADPLDRRFHAQPDACFACGPHLTWRERSGDAAAGSAGTDVAKPKKARDGTEDIEAAESDGTCAGAAERARTTPAVGRTRAESDAIIERCAEVLAHGGIVAIKGLGGFHLACNATDEASVRELRRRKRRSNKPLAIMVRDVATAERWCVVDDTERTLLEGTVRPIVLLRRRGGNAAGNAARSGGFEAPDDLAPSVALDLPELGVMLPYTPLQHLLLAACAELGIRALVMTSGNVSEEPIETDDELAWRHLVAGGLADALLGNDRAILSRFDDSVVRVVEGTVRLVRRARGYAPRPLELPRIHGTGQNGSGHGHTKQDDDGPTGGASKPSAPLVILACGPEQKATLALTRERPDGTAECLLSQHIGDLENAETFDAWQACRTRMQELFDVKPTALACDLHPTYLASQWARAEAERRDLPLMEIQHHHAHIASVIAEAAARGELAPDATVAGLALDGTGAGTDGTVWGGEVLVASLTSCRRAAHLRTWRLPGGTAAIRDARRNAFGLLAAYGLLDHPGAQPLLGTLDRSEHDLLHTMVERGLNSPVTSSMGRFLDAVAAILGICPRATYEGEPAVELEAAAVRASGQEKPVADVGGAALGETDVIDLRPLLDALLDGIARGDDLKQLALGVHRAIARVMAGAAAEVAHREHLDTVALSGGVFLNRLLLTGITRELEARGLRVLVAESVPVNDGCIAYGQAAVARARLARA